MNHCPFSSTIVTWVEIDLAIALHTGGVEEISRPKGPDDDIDRSSGAAAQEAEIASDSRIITWKTRAPSERAASQCRTACSRNEDKIPVLWQSACEYYCCGG